MGEPAPRTPSSPSHATRRYQSRWALTDMTTPEEYAMLPASVQRKYFSSVERLRIAQHVAVEKRKKQKRQETWLPPSSMADLTTQAPPHDAPGARPASSRSSIHPMVTCETRFNDPITQDQARWFLSLPDKFKKQHFSREELLLLTQHSWDVLQGVHDESEDSSAHSERSLSSCTHDVNAAVDGSVNGGSCTPTTENTYDDCNAPLETEELSRQLSEISKLESELAFFPTSSQKRASTTTAISAPPQDQKAKRKSFRALTLIPIALPPPTLSPVPSLPKVNVRNFSRLSRPSQKPLHSKDDTPAPKAAKYYQDPDARRQLRTYLASAQKFDEVLEFGFPSSGMSTPASREGSCSIQRSESAMSQDTVDTRGPRTPTLSLDQVAAHPAFYENGIGSSLHLHDIDPAKKDLPDGLNGSRREMTIRMTLTRPELSGGAHGGKQQMHTSIVDVAEADPLALEPLPVCEDATGAQGAFAIQDQALQKKTLGRVWKSMRRR